MGKTVKKGDNIKKIYYRKLVRDKIPQRIKESGGRFEIKALSQIDYKKYLLEKVSEEASGISLAKSRKEVASEMGDLLDVLEEVKTHFKIKPEDLKESRQKEFQRKGGFKKKIFLIWAEDTGYKTNEKRGKAK